MSRFRWLVVTFGVLLGQVLNAGYLYSQEVASFQDSLLTLVNLDEINCVVFSDNGDSIYVGTRKGIFKTIDNGINWQNVYKSNSQDEEDIFSLAVDKKSNKIFVGAKLGLYKGSEKTNLWEKVDGGLTGEDVKSVVMRKDNDEVIYVSTNRGIFKSKDLAKTWNKIYAFSDIVKNEDDESESESDAETEDESTINPVNALLADRGKLFIATADGLFSLGNNSNSKMKEVERLSGEDIRALSFGGSKDIIYIATKKEILKYDIPNDSLIRISSNVDFKELKDIDYSSKDKKLYILDEGNIYSMITTKDDSSKLALNNNLDLDQAVDLEPSIREIQKQAIKYAEVSPEKIESWRKGAKLRSAMPEFSVGYDKTVTTALGASYDRVQVGPRDWSIDLSWDLADLVWNPHQKDIDVRSRLMVQLRNDILEDVTRIYFERIKLKRELAVTKDLEKRADKELRIEELTAKLDGLTGGYFSRRVEELNK